MSPLRVAFLTDKSAPAYVGGYEVRVYELARRLAKHHTVEILSCSPEGPADGVRFEQVYPSAFQVFPTGERSRIHTTLCGVRTLALGRRLRSFDVVVVEAIPYAHLLGVAWASRNARPKVVLDVSEAWGEFRPSTARLTRVEESLVQHLLRLGVASADSVVAVSSATARSLVRSYGVAPESVHVVPNGFAPVDVGARSEPPERYDFLAVARLVEHKRIGDFVEALARLREQEGWRGLGAVVGDGPLRSLLERTARDRGLAERLRFLGFLTGGEKDAILAASRCFVLPSEREGFSIAALEAMARGLPVVASRPASDDVYGVGDLVEDDVTGYTYPTGDVAALARLLQRIRSSEETRERLSQGARNRARPLTWDSAADRLEALLEGVVAA